MKSILIIALFLSVSTTFAGQINEIECSGAPEWIQLKLSLNFDKGTFHGVGIENYAHLNFDCKGSTNTGTILCESPSPFGDKIVSAIISINKDNIVTAEYYGIYSDHRNIKIGCIAGM